MEGLCKTLHLIADKTAAPGAVSALDAADAGSDLDRSVAILRAGGTVAFPTETVYGLGANALDELAVAKIFTAKQRPAWDPLIVHISDRAMLDRVAKIPEEFSERVERLIAAFWPGPLTLLLPKTSAVPDAVTAARPLVGVRMPAHPVALELIRLAGVPIAAPSANRFGHTSPTSAAHVFADLDGRIDAVLDGGTSQVGIESTVLAVCETPMLIYRPGAVTETMIRDATGVAVNVFVASEPHALPASLPSPGVGLRHYAPRARLELVAAFRDAPPDALRDAVKRFQAANEVVGVMLPDGWDAGSAEESFTCGSWEDNVVFAQRLFAGLRALDAREVDVIVCPVPSGNGVGVAIRNRLEKAARPR